MQLLLIFLISTFQTTPIEGVIRFKMRSCDKARRNVTLVIATPYTTFRNSEHDTIISFTKLEKYAQKKYYGQRCLSISLYIITANGVFKLTAKHGLQDFIKAIDEKSTKSTKSTFENIFDGLKMSEYFLSGETVTNELDWSTYFLEQYKKEIDDNEDKLLVFFKVDSIRDNRIITELGEVRKVTPVVVVFPFHAVDAINSYPELGLQYPLHQILFFPI